MKSYTLSSLALHFGLALVERNIPLDLVHALQRLRVIPRCILHFCFVGCYCVVARVAFVGAVGGCGCGAKVRFLDGVGWELGGC